MPGKWTSDFCNTDSHKDGLSNGEELGDPDCIWTPGKQTSKRTENISHPGICEPLKSATCQQQNKWLKCNGNKDKCESLNEKGILRTSLRIPATSIPSKQTSYYCMLFSLPSNDTFHLVGTKPIIDNKDITHHILLFGCNEQEGQIIPSEEPYECGMLAHRQCVNIIGTWTVGSDGDCFHNSTGFKIGSSGFQTAAIQIHWNNRNRIPNMTDSSGLELFYTPNLRQYEAGMFAVGQEYLNIPPRVPNISFRSRCSSACTEVMFPKGVFITRAVNHMHYKGIQQNIEIYRGNKKIRDITHEEEYTYDKPVFYQFDPPIRIRPGDEIRTTCTYSSLSSNETIFFGEGTSDEMCYGFITYYPAQNIALPYCTTWKTVEKCKRYMPQFGGIIDGCKWKDFLSGGNEYIGFMMIELAMHCDTTCSSNCTEKVRNLREHECLRGDLGDFMIFKLQRKYPSISLIKDCFRENKSDNLKAYSYCLILSLAIMYFS
ncbi:unnamed protein product [Mytilus edulis]|uniref:Uncharacterized protein n=1 Tax=Mytilus edulis TaxID=6550 RepID=A0A8S3SH44_MYTED|nr:unnamed protein product [Mytilus edulis]